MLKREWPELMLDNPPWKEKLISVAKERNCVSMAKALPSKEYESMKKSGESCYGNWITMGKDSLPHIWNSSLGNLVFVLWVTLGIYSISLFSKIASIYFFIYVFIGFLTLRNLYLQIVITMINTAPVVGENYLHYYSKKVTYKL